MRKSILTAQNYNCLPGYFFIADSENMNCNQGKKHIVKSLFFNFIKSYFQGLVHLFWDSSVHFCNVWFSSIRVLTWEKLNFISIMRLLECYSDFYTGFIDRSWAHSGPTSRSTFCCLKFQHRLTWFHEHNTFTSNHRFRIFWTQKRLFFKY